MDKEVIKLFNTELEALYEAKLPISKTRINRITDIALTSGHNSNLHDKIVHSVERFIQKGLDRHKLPGLYLIDSIVKFSKQRNDAHDKYEALFGLNLKATFEGAFQTCHEKDKAVMVRLLNLWQANRLFPVSVVQPLFDFITNSDKTNDEITPAIIDPQQAFINSLEEAVTKLMDNLPSDSDHDVVENLQDSLNKLKNISCELTNPNSIEKGPQDQNEKEFTPQSLSNTSSPHCLSSISNSESAQLNSPFAASISPNGRHSSRRNCEPGQSRSRSRSRSPSKASRSRQKCFPSPRPGCVTIFSNTLWIGHVPKHSNETSLSDTFSKYGVIKSVDFISSRGCAFVCFVRRKDAFKALSDSKKSTWILDNNIKIQWANGKGTKDKAHYKEYFDQKLGCSFIPLPAMHEDGVEVLDELEQGGEVDEDSMPYLNELRKLSSRVKAATEESQRQATSAINLVNNINETSHQNLAQLDSFTTVSPAVSQVEPVCWTPPPLLPLPTTSTTPAYYDNNYQFPPNIQSQYYEEPQFHNSPFGPSLYEQRGGNNNNSFQPSFDYPSNTNNSFHSMEPPLLPLFPFEQNPYHPHHRQYNSRNNSHNYNQRPFYLQPRNNHHYQLDHRNHRTEHRL